MDWFIGIVVFWKELTWGICDQLLTGKKYTKPNETLDYPRRNMMNERIFDHGKINQKTN